MADENIEIIISDEQPIHVTIQGISCAGTGGDMLKSIYDTNNNGIVDKAESVDDGAGKSKTAAEIHDHIDNTEIHKTHTYVPEYRAYEVEE